VKRTPLTRRTRLARTPIKKRGRGARFRGYAPDKAFRAYVKSHGCLLASSRCHSVLDFAHVRSRGAGGQDAGNGVCLCRTHHREQHRIGIESFQAKYGLDLRVHAERLWAHHQTEEAR
jgi:hypothetical protein